MRANLALLGDLPLAEAAVTQLTPALGRASPTPSWTTRCRRAADDGTSLAEALRVTGHEVDLAPEHYLGSAPALVDAALQARSAVGTTDA